MIDSSQDPLNQKMIGTIFFVSPALYVFVVGAVVQSCTDLFSVLTMVILAVLSCQNSSYTLPLLYKQ